MAARLPVVTTPLGIEGMGAQDKEQVLIAKSAEDLAEKAVALLKKPQLEEKKAESAFSLVKEKYNWQLISTSLDKIYKKLGGKP